MSFFITSINKDNLLTITARGNEVCVIEDIELVYSRIKVKNGKHLKVKVILLFMSTNFSTPCAFVELKKR